MRLQEKWWRHSLHWVLYRGQSGSSLGEGVADLPVPTQNGRVRLTEYVLESNLLTAESFFKDGGTRILIFTIAQKRSILYPSSQSFASTSSMNLGRDVGIWKEDCYEPRQPHSSDRQGLVSCVDAGYTCQSNGMPYQKHILIAKLVPLATATQ